MPVRTGCGFAGNTWDGLVGSRPFPSLPVAATAALVPVTPSPKFPEGGLWL